jgi:hypothetical protein
MIVFENYIVDSSLIKIPLSFIPENINTSTTKETGR